ncbi:MAG TPA: MerR family transcriptional regulator [Chloroflexota bacterium]|nr:MerR family transcriptional regulator [Chloroflexota bacterium]
MAEVGYSLGALIDAAAAAEGVRLSERAARQYFAQGLLPPARGVHANSLYGEDHLLRLRLIIRLAAQYVPARDMLGFLDRLPTASQRAVLDRGPIARLPAEGDAQAYLQRLTAGLRMHQEGGTAAAVPDDPAKRQRPVVVLPKQRPDKVVPSAPPKIERSDWARVSVDPDVELLVRLFPGRDPQRLLDAMTEAVRAALRKEREGSSS